MQTYDDEHLGAGITSRERSDLGAALEHART
jgi:hypothetical protein